MFQILLSAHNVWPGYSGVHHRRGEHVHLHHHGYHRERGRLHPGSVVKPYLCCCVGGPSHFSHYCSPWTPGLLHAVQQANGGLLNTSVPQDVQQVPIFSPGMADHGLFNLASMFQALPALYVFRENKLYIQILF